MVVKKEELFTKRSFFFFFLIFLPHTPPTIYSSPVLFLFFCKKRFCLIQKENKVDLQVILRTISSFVNISHNFKPQPNLPLQKRNDMKPFHTYLKKSLNQSRFLFSYFFDQHFDTVFLSFHNHLHIA